MDERPKLEFIERSKPSYHKSLVTGNLFEYGKYSNIDEEKWWPPNSPEIKQLAIDALKKYPDKVIEYRNGKKGVLSLFMGDVMKAGKGKINPQLASETVKRLLEEKGAFCSL